MKPAIRHSALVGSIGCANFRGHDFEMHCVCCGEECLWRSDLLLRRHGHDYPVAEFSRNFACQGCGGTGTSVLRITDRPADQQASRFRRMAPRAIPLGAPPAEARHPTVHAWGLRPADEGMAAC